MTVWDSFTGVQEQAIRATAKAHRRNPEDLAHEWAHLLTDGPVQLQMDLPPVPHG